MNRIDLNVNRVYYINILYLPTQVFFLIKINIISILYGFQNYNNLRV